VTARPLRIALITGRFPVASETFVTNLATGLLERGHDVHVLTYSNRSRSALPSPPGFDHRIHHGRRVPTDRFTRMVRLPALLPQIAAHPRLTWRCARAGGLRTVHQAIPHFHHAPFDILHCQFADFGHPTLHLRDAGVLSGSLVTSWRGYDISTIPGSAHAFVLDRVLRESAMHLPNCEHFAQSVKAMGADPERTCVFSSGLDTSRFPTRPQAIDRGGTIRIGIIGRLVEKKGVEYALRALAHLSPTHPTAQLEIVGDGELRAALESLATELGIAHRVRFLGQQPISEVARLLQRWHIVLAPSVTAANGDTDGPVNSLKEAMATGIPVIGTHHGGIPELIDPGVSGYLVPERDAKALANTLGRLLDQPESWEAMGHAGATRIRERFHLQGQLDLLEELYARVLES